MKKLLLLFSALLLAGGAWAQDDEELQPVQKLIVHMMNGQKIEFLLDDEPVTKFEPGQMSIQTSGHAPVLYLIENVRRYTYEGIPEGLDDPIVAPGTILVRQNNEMMLIVGLPDQANVAVYNVDGKLLFSQKAVGGQSTPIIMSAYPAGNYIINAGGTSFKFVKQ